RRARSYRCGRAIAFSVGTERRRLRAERRLVAARVFGAQRRAGAAHLALVVLVAAGIEENGRLVLANRAIAYQLTKRKERRTTFGAGIDAFGSSHLGGGGLDPRFVDGDRAAIRLAQRAHHQAVADGARDP